MKLKDLEDKVNRLSTTNDELRAENARLRALAARLADEDEDEYGEDDIPDSSTCGPHFRSKSRRNQ